MTWLHVLWPLILGLLNGFLALFAAAWAARSYGWERIVQAGLALVFLIFAFAHVIAWAFDIGQHTSIAQ